MCRIRLSQEKMKKMKRKAKTMLLLLAALTATDSSAQDYPQTDEDGRTIYYKVMSACPEYAATRLCVQDKSQSRTGYTYVLMKHDAQEQRQEWMLIAVSAADHTYNLRNRVSYRYVSTAGSWVDDIYVPTYAVRKVDSDALTLTPISDDQVTISYRENGDERLLAARKVGMPLPPKGDSLVDSPWAWRIVRTSEVTGIEEAHAGCQEGHPAVFDLTGRRISDRTLRSRTLPHGVYVVVGKKIII